MAAFADTNELVEVVSVGASPTAKDTRDFADAGRDAENEPWGQSFGDEAPDGDVTSVGDDTTAAQALGDRVEEVQGVLDRIHEAVARVNDAVADVEARLAAGPDLNVQAGLIIADMRANLAEVRDRFRVARDEGHDDGRVEVDGAAAAVPGAVAGVDAAVDAIEDDAAVARAAAADRDAGQRPQVARKGAPGAAPRAPLGMGYARFPTTLSGHHFHRRNRMVGRYWVRINPEMDGTEASASQLILIYNSMFEVVGNVERKNCRALFRMIDEGIIDEDNIAVAFPDGVRGAYQMPMILYALVPIDQVAIVERRYRDGVERA